MKKTSGNEITDPRLKDYCKIGGLSALLCASFAILQMVIEVIGVRFVDPVVPNSVIGWYNILQNHRLLGITELTFFQIPAFVFAIPVFLALYIILKQSNEIYVTIAVILSFVGIAIYLATNTASAMLSLSDKYAAATTETEKLMYLASGQAMLSIYENSGVNVGSVLILISTLIISTVMLRSNIFSKITAYTGILAGVVGTVYYFKLFVPEVGIFILEGAGAMFVVWIFMIGRRLLHLS